LCLGGDALRPPFAALFDAVLLDAPCTGLGTLGRHPDIRWRMKEEEIARHGARQAGLLESVSGLVRPGGRLVYSVCSPEPEEGAGVVGAFMSRHEEFIRGPLPEWAQPFLGPDGFLRTAPEQDGGDAFFLAVLDRH
jgi:16S rRNA (cytosine967-C5)-methyltransferase